MIAPIGYQFNPINMGVAEQRFAMTPQNIPRWNAIPARAVLIETQRLGSPWVDLCFWNESAWQYVTTRTTL